MIKKTLTALILALTLCSCGERGEKSMKDIEREHLEYVQRNTNFEIVRTLEIHTDGHGYTGRHIVMIDGAEYIWSYRWLGSYTGTESLTRK